MPAHKKQTQELAKKLFQLSLENGVVSQERVAGVLQYVEVHKPANALGVLRAYRRLVAAELARANAVVEHAGTIDNSVVKHIAAAMTSVYKRPIAATAKPNNALIAGLRVRVGDDVYESSIASRLQALTSVS